MLRVRKSNRDGAMVVLFALLLPILIVILGFTIDYANMQRVRNEIQVVADLSAKAAADTLASTGDIAAARSAAKRIGSLNHVGGDALTIDDNQIVFGRAVPDSNGRYAFTEGATPFNSVKVFAERMEGSANGPLDLMFGRFYGRPSLEIQKSATASFVNVEVCLVIDRSGSMKRPTQKPEGEDLETNTTCKLPNNGSRWVSVSNAIDIFLGELDATAVQEKVALVTFASNCTDCNGITISESTLDVPLTVNLTAVRNQMDNLSNSIWFGNTNVTSGLFLGRTHMNSASDPSAERVIILLTDGKYNEGGSPMAEASSAAASGFTVHTITFSDEANQGDMVALAAAGNGIHHHADTDHELREIFRRLANTFTVITE